MTGEGKSTCLYQLFKEYCVLAKIPWEWDFLTWDRAELLTWIDGDDEGNGQKREYSPIMCDELISMFYKRNWFDDAQKSSVELLNKCRDRHLFIAGAVPNFWDLDAGILTRFRFYLYVKERGEAWIFQQENNPFASDKWNLAANKKIYTKTGKAWRCPNFLGILKFPDFNPDEKKEYYEIRNLKRIGTEGQNKADDQPQNRTLKKVTIARNRLIKYILEHTNAPLTEIGAAAGISATCIGDIMAGRKGYRLEFEKPRFDIKNYPIKKGVEQAPQDGEGTK